MPFALHFSFDFQVNFRMRYSFPLATFIYSWVSNVGNLELGEPLYLYFSQSTTFSSRDAKTNQNMRCDLRYCAILECVVFLYLVFSIVWQFLRWNMDQKCFSVRIDGCVQSMRRRGFSPALIEQFCGFSVKFHSYAKLSFIALASPTSIMYYLAATIHTWARFNGSSDDRILRAEMRDEITR